MSITAYQQSIFKSRAIPFKATKSVQERQLTALKQATSQLTSLIDQIADGEGKLVRGLYLAKKMSIQTLMNQLAEGISSDISESVASVTEETASLMADITEKLGDDELDLSNFATVPQTVLQDYAHRADVEGLKISPSIWAGHQTALIENKVMTALTRGQSATTLAKDLQQFINGGSEGMGHSIAYKAMRLARTEINTAYHESRRLSAITSPVVAGMEWKLSNRHPVWDVCNLLAQQDLFGMGQGVYPAEQLPPKPHPNCICYTMDKLRDPADWQKPKPTVTAKSQPIDFQPTGKGTDHYIKKQYKVFTGLMDRAIADAPLYPVPEPPAPTPPPPPLPIEFYRDPTLAGSTFTNANKGFSILSKGQLEQLLGAIPDYNDDGTYPVTLIGLNNLVEDYVASNGWVMPPTGELGNAGQLAIWARKAKKLLSENDYTSIPPQVSQEDAEVSAIYEAEVLPDGLPIKDIISADNFAEMVKWIKQADPQKVEDGGFFLDYATKWIGLNGTEWGYLSGQHQIFALDLLKAIKKGEIQAPTPTPEAKAEVNPTVVENLWSTTVLKNGVEVKAVFYKGHQELVDLLQWMGDNEGYSLQDLQQEWTKTNTAAQHLNTETLTIANDGLQIILKQALKPVVPATDTKSEQLAAFLKVSKDLSVPLDALAWDEMAEWAALLPFDQDDFGYEELADKWGEIDAASAHGATMDDYAKLAASI